MLFDFIFFNLPHQFKLRHGQSQVKDSIEENYTRIVYYPTSRILTYNNIEDEEIYALITWKGIHILKDGILEEVKLKNHVKLNITDKDNFIIDGEDHKAYVFTDKQVIAFSVDNKIWHFQQSFPDKNPIATQGISGFMIIDSLILINYNLSSEVGVFHKSKGFIGQVSFGNLPSDNNKVTEKIVRKIENEVLCIKKGVFYELNISDRSFKIDKKRQAIFNPNNNDIDDFIVDEKGNVIISFHQKYNEKLPNAANENYMKNWWIEVFYKNGEVFLRDTLLFKALRDRPVNISINNSGILILQYPNFDEVYTVDYSKPYTFEGSIPSNTLIRKVTIKNDSIIFGGAYGRKDDEGFHRIMNIQPSDKILNF